MGVRPAFAEAEPGETESHGLSIFGELAEQPDFPHFAYVNPSAPKGGTLVMEPPPPEKTATTRSTLIFCAAIRRRASASSSTR